MKTITIFILLCLISLTGNLSAKIIETKNFHEIEHYLKPDTLLILDIDDTLLIPAQTLGTDVWFRYRLGQHQEVEKDFSKALNRAISEWEAIRHITKVKIVEDGTDEIIKRLQQKNITIMGLTTQGLELATCTVDQLHSLNIDLSKAAPTQNHHYFTSRFGILYRHGILFTSGIQKGVALFNLLDQIDFKPKHIVFINDKDTNIREVEIIAEEKGIDFIGLRYSYCDERINSFRKEIADIQWKHSTFDRILSDEEAEEMLRAQPALASCEIGYYSR